MDRIGTEQHTSRTAPRETWQVARSAPPYRQIGGGICSSIKIVRCVIGKIIFHLDSICPTGLGKVAGVKIEIHDEKLAGGGEVPRECKRQNGECRPAINGISREKAQMPHKQRTFCMARWRHDAIATGISRCGFRPQSLCLRIVPTEHRFFDMAVVFNFPRPHGATGLAGRGNSGKM
jgi:hypothetical protein